MGAGSPLWWLKSQYRWNPCAWAGGSDSVPGAPLVCRGVDFNSALWILWSRHMSSQVCVICLRPLLRAAKPVTIIHLPSLPFP